VLLAVLMCTAGVAAAEVATIPAYGWRGNGTGVYAGSKLPLEWDGLSGKNIRWRVKMPANACAMPVFGPDRVLVLADPDRILCYSTKDGTLLWERTLSAIDAVVAEADKEAWRAKFHEAWTLLTQSASTKGPDVWTKKPKDIKDEASRTRCQTLYNELGQYGISIPTWQMTGYTVCTPAANDKYVVVPHWSNVVACYDWDGNRQWIQQPTPDKKYRVQNEQGNSPLALVDDLLIATWIPKTSRGGGTSAGELSQEAFVAYAVATGKERWRSEPLRSGGCMSGAPIPFKVGDETLIVNFAGCVVRVSDGKVVLRDVGWSSGNSPTVLGDVLCFWEAPHWYGPRKGGYAYAVRIAKRDDEYTATKLWEWTAPPGDTVNHRSPVAYDGKFYVPYGLVFDLETGKVLIGPPKVEGARKPPPSVLTMQGHYGYPSPFVASGRLYLPAADGATRVYDADISETKPPKLLAANYLGSKGKKTATSVSVGCVSPPAVLGDCIYQRTTNELLCIGETTVLCPPVKVEAVAAAGGGDAVKP
ncbi:MAG: PQQ-binding-like beta-propeller repeat protein, partial [bacterium]